jgi:hypothetical protein
MSEHVNDPARQEAWGDVQMPSEAQQRQERQQGVPGAVPGAREESLRDSDRSTDAQRDPTLREDTNAYGLGATTLQPSLGPGYAHQPLGPGNEAMEGGASPAPRGYTGGAMGKYVAGLSPSFSEAAGGGAAPGGLRLYTPAEEAATFTNQADMPTPQEPEGPPIG